MRVVVVGAAGQLGAVTVAEWTAAGHEVVGVVRADLDVASGRQVRSTLGTLAPEVVINCAAYNDVDGAESDPLTAMTVNGLAVMHLARATNALGALFVHYSTDFVFDGNTDRPYTESDSPCPRSVYAVSKLLGELFAAEVPRHLVLRVESLFGGPAPRSSIDRMVSAILAGQEVRAFSDRVVSPSYVFDVAMATRRLVTDAAPPGLYHCVNSGYTTWLNLAHALRAILNRPASPVIGCLAADVKARACRPVFAALSNAKLAAEGIAMPDWHAALVAHRARRFGGNAARTTDAPPIRLT